MARLILLSISMFLLLALVFESSVAWPAPDDDEDTVAEKTQVSDEGGEALSNLEDINEQTVKKQDDDVDEDAKEEDVQEQDDEENAVALANFDDKLDADIEQAGVCGCNLKAYDKTFYRGRMLLLKQQNANFLNDYYNDRIESVKVLGRCQWILYQHINFLGTSYILKPGRYPYPKRWGGVRNQISSARALPPKGKVAIVLFQHSYYRGRMLTLYTSNRNFLKLNFNDKMSSFIITGGRWTLYKHINYRGVRMTRGPGKYPTRKSWSRFWISTPGNDQVSSVKRVTKFG